jgi:Farnesoic acid 0-methyl transferase
MEILIGENNNTRSIIRADGEFDIVNIATPGILEPNSWVGFRIAFSNWMVLVFRENDQFPFMACNMQQFYPMNFYGIRSP